MPGIAIGNMAEATQPDAQKAALAEFISMLIFVFAGQGSGMAFGEHSSLYISTEHELYHLRFVSYLNTKYVK